MRLLVWLFRSLVFFTLFAFALNNQHVATVHWFFGVQWQAPMVFVVLAAFTSGCALGVLALAPRAWRRTRAAGSADQGVAVPPATQAQGPMSPPRDGL